MEPQNPHQKIAIENIDKSLSVSAKRTESIVSALYIVSNILPENEPLQVEIRKAGLSLISHTNDIIGSTGNGYMEKEAAIANCVKKILSYLEVGTTMLLISEMNHRILRHELMALAGSYESRKNTLAGIYHLLGVATTLPEKQPQESGFYKGHIKDTTYKGQKTPLGDTQKKIPISYTQPKNEFLVKASSPTNDDRKNKIVSKLSTQVATTIADIKSAVPDVSFKTLQRDLQSLIDEGKVIREGERRWSVYRLKD